MRKNEWNICGYIGVQTYENPNTAMRTIRCSNEDQCQCIEKRLRTKWYN